MASKPSNNTKTRTNKKKDTVHLTPLRRWAAIGLLAMCASTVLMPFLLSSGAYDGVVISPLQLLGEASLSFCWSLVILWVVGIVCSIVFAIRVLRAKKPVNQRFAFAALIIVSVASLLTIWSVSNCVGVRHPNAPDTFGSIISDGLSMGGLLPNKCADVSGVMIFCLVYIALLVILVLPDIVRWARMFRQKRKAYLRSLSKK